MPTEKKLTGYPSIDKHSHRRKLVDAFVNALFLYDDKLVIIINYKDGAKTVKLEDVNSSPLGSETSILALPKRNDNFRQKIVVSFVLFTFIFSFFSLLSNCRFSKVFSLVTQVFTFSYNVLYGKPSAKYAFSQALGFAVHKVF